MPSASDIAIKLELAPGANVVVTLQPGSDVLPVQGRFGTVFNVPCVADGQRAILAGGNRFWTAIRQYQLTADKTGQPLTVRVSKKGDGTATTYSVEKV